MASIFRTAWGPDRLEGLSLNQQFFGPRDGREHWIGQWREEIERADKKDPLYRGTVYWSITERLFDELSREETERTIHLRYEDAVTGGARLMSECLYGLGLKQITSSLTKETLEKASYSSTDDRRAIGQSDRLEGWKGKLTVSEVRTIEQIVEQFGLEGSLAAS